jgi:hypothetical protein
MQRWGTTAVTSAFEVYLTLAAPPTDTHAHRAWLDLLAIEPPVWGGTRAARAASKLTARGFRVWSWDDQSVVFSDPDTQPPRGLRHRPWNPLLVAPQPSPRSRAMRPLFGP